MKPHPSYLRATAAPLLVLLATTIGNDAQAQQPAFTLLYTFQRVGGTPLSIIEAGPGDFLGVAGASPAVFNITGAGTLSILYPFSDLHGPVPARASPERKSLWKRLELRWDAARRALWVGAKGAVSTLQYNGAT
jgi:hypothetical protein